MTSTDSSDKKKSLLISTAIYAVLLLLLFFIRFWPPYNPENNVALAQGGGGGGVTVNFGDSDLGSGANYKSEVLEVKNNVKQAPAKATPDEAIITQENTTDDNDVVIPTKEKPKKATPVVKPEAKPVPEKPKVSNSTNDALSSILKGSNKGGDGDDKVAGNKGKANGSLGSNGYYGTGGSGGGTGGGNGTGNGIGTGSGYGAGSGGGSGGGSGYSLGNRKALSKPAPKYTCDEAGKVVVEVTVDQSGKTISATPGIKGTTNTAKCLLDQAKIAAMNTKWSPDENATAKQVGRIIYNFSLD
ncbi:outer membrane transport energization protein TonB [Flavobacterium sp. 90]|uniref:energy transducer TonB n=1 Tax=unclassified Flavobacterium TaxID=196869 RepID=UPI000EAED0EE|nr:MULTISPECIES: energy transducer TonB [unclassified Flavobacterium]RKR10789.1 outer membrane transport energization protein TonB [Flavobacterium sp. 81]TCK54571.1 outer membrane transport energization protein TonB [Flavobacterium sp. 90]